jgi:hypothetical protein
MPEKPIQPWFLQQIKLDHIDRELAKLQPAGGHKSTLRKLRDGVVVEASEIDVLPIGDGDKSAPRRTALLKEYRDITHDLMHPKQA